MDYALLFADFSQRHSQRGWPRQRLLHECLRAAILEARLAQGTRLVASRTLASELGMARNSVLYAYEQLGSEGLVRTDQRGTHVAVLAPPRGVAGAIVTAHAPAVAAVAPRPGLARRAYGLRPERGGAHDGAGAFVPGVPALDAFPLALWRRTLERSQRALTPAQLNYGDVAGEPLLRAAIADHLRTSRGVVCEAHQVFITDGTQSSMDICMRACADPGEVLWLEQPGYGGALAAGRGAGLEVRGIGVDAAGMAPQPADWDQPPRLIYLTPSHQYPTGGVLGLERRLALLAGARAAGALIIEDDYDSEFRHEGPPLPALQGLAPDAPVIYLGTFSKTMFPALRIGFMVVPAALAAPFLALRRQCALGGRSAEQLALAEFLRGGQFARHVRRMRRLYRQRRDALVLALQRHLGPVASVHGASAGMHLALRLHDARLCDVALSAQALARGIAAPALSGFGVQGASGWSGLLLGYAQVPVEQVDALVRQLAALVHLALFAANGGGRQGTASAG